MERLIVHTEIGVGGDDGLIQTGTCRARLVIPPTLLPGLRIEGDQVLGGLRRPVRIGRPHKERGGQAQVRLCKRYRRLVGRGKHPNVVVTAIARELLAFMWAIAKEVPVAG